jgi:hypothetical protein
VSIGARTRRSLAGQSVSSVGSPRPRAGGHARTVSLAAVVEVRGKLARERGDQRAGAAVAGDPNRGQTRELVRRKRQQRAWEGDGDHFVLLAAVLQPARTRKVQQREVTREQGGLPLALRENGNGAIVSATSCW